MNPELSQLAEEYARALESYLGGRGEAALQEAYDLGRKTLAKGLGVLDIATIQHRALLKCLVRARTAKEGARTLRTANKLFVESLLPFEMSHRRIQEVNTALRESEQRYRNLVDTARDVIYTLSLDGKIKSLNPVFETITGWSRAEWIGREFLPLIHSDDLPRAATHIKAVLDGRVPPTFELRVLTKSGAYVPGEFMATPLIQDAQLVGVLGVARDITDRKRAEEALRGLNEALEEEVKRIAHALHDEAGQLLASVHIGLADVVRDLPPHAAQRLEDVQGLLHKIEEQLRHLSHELRPTILDDLGLRPALEFLADGVSRRAGHRPGGADQRDEARAGDPRVHPVRPGRASAALRGPRQRLRVRCPRGAGPAGLARSRPHRDPGTAERGRRHAEHHRDAQGWNRAAHLRTRGGGRCRLEFSSPMTT